MIPKDKNRCAFATADLIQRIGRLRCDLLEPPYTHKIYDDLVPHINDSIGLAIKDLPQIKKFCEIETGDAEKSLNLILHNLSKINDKYYRDNMQENILSIEEIMTGKRLKSK